MDLSQRNSWIFSGLMAGAAGVAWSPLLAATAIATVEANIISIISIATRNGLSFGDISSSASAGTVILTPGGSRGTSGGATINTASGHAPATFDLEGTPNASYAISLPLSVELSDGASNTMSVEQFTSSPLGSGVLDNNGRQTLYVGASLNVNDNQPYGSYSGQMVVTVAYN